ncbi:thioredoxin family protein [Zoogloea sp.]|jgi:thioredoxin 1|uniref:thioredoxin family protein n=1 Tax=Zoogloea sp. TaxID=49181 RepID=UPI001B5872B2|nr:thioredoxin family protein [Zoogloea sp.]MBK6654068.1 thioredoxin family protein [Zoogloea sp.]MBP7443979.1 thioredoxin family protein [Zoogloea sp.]HPI62160.1 thioredoxin family protein [Zoogloea sp.]
MKTLTRLLATATLTLAASAASALDIQPYTPQALAAAQQAGKPVALHFHADWCPTCRAQEKVFNSFKAEPGLDLPLLVVDYDKERALKQSLKVRTQSTVIIYRGTRETARVAGETDEARLRAALKSAL